MATELEAANEMFDQLANVLRAIRAELDVLNTRIQILEEQQSEQWRVLH